MKTLLPIVGMAFRPPAARVLALLPFGAELHLQREPHNPYDSNAIKVLLPDFNAEGQYSEIFKSMKNEAIMDAADLSRGQWHESALQDPLMLGYVSAKTGHAALVAAEMDRPEKPSPFASGELSALASGAPAFELECDEALAGELEALEWA